MTYEETLQFLYGCHTTIYEGLTRMQYLLDQLGNPQHAFPSVLITGTNGKGSVAKMISAVLQRAGYRVGCFTSPHLLDFSERITINAEPIAHADVVSLTEELRQGVLAAFERDRERIQLKGQVCFFELVTAMAFAYFARQHVDLAVLEVGIGGRLDATNTVNPLVSVVTNVGLDHQQLLGNTIAAITREKSGIIRPHGDVVSSCQHPEARAVIAAVCQQQQATLYQAGIEGSPCEQPLSVRIVPRTIAANGSVFTYHGLFRHIADVSLRLAGTYQLSNAAVALGTLELLDHKGFSWQEHHLREGFAAVSHPGRLEIMHTQPCVVVDIAHNAMGAAAIANALTTLFEFEKLIMVIGVLHDKDVSGILRPLMGIANALIFTSPHHTQRAETASATAQIAENLLETNGLPRDRYSHWLVCETVEDALRAGHAIANERDLICVTGSNYTVSEAELFYTQHLGGANAR